MEADSGGRGEWPTPSSAVALERAEFSWPHFGQVGEALARSVRSGGGRRGEGREKERIE